MICRHCGFKVPEGSEYCDNCGHKISSAGFMDKFDEVREDDITHAGEHPRKTNMFADRVHDVPGTSGKKVKKTAVKTTRTGSSRKGQTQQKLAKILLPIIFFIIYIVIQVLTEVLD